MSAHHIVFELGHFTAGPDVEESTCWVIGSSAECLNGVWELYEDDDDDEMSYENCIRMMMKCHPNCMCMRTRMMMRCCYLDFYTYVWRVYAFNKFHAAQCNNITNKWALQLTHECLTLPSGNRVTELISLSWPLNVIVHFPVLMSQTFARLSHDPIIEQRKGRGKTMEEEGETRGGGRWEISVRREQRKCLNVHLQNIFTFYIISTA